MSDYRPAYRALRALSFAATAAILAAALLTATLPAPHSGHGVGVTIDCAAQAATRQPATAECHGGGR
jgi:F0F1-type ATP synthase membrane subunit c/vacuolar-type H+-ATPase subunit K